MIYCYTWTPLPISTWIAILLVFSFKVGPRTDLIIVVFLCSSNSDGVPNVSKACFDIIMTLHKSTPTTETQYLSCFWPDFDQTRYLRSSLAGHNCQSDIFPGNICPGCICHTKDNEISYTIWAWAAVLQSFTVRQSAGKGLVGHYFCYNFLQNGQYDQSWTNSDLNQNSFFFQYLVINGSECASFTKNSDFNWEYKKTRWISLVSSPINSFVVTLRLEQTKTAATKWLKLGNPESGLSNIIFKVALYQVTSSSIDHLLSKVIFHQRWSSIKGHLPLKVVLNQRLLSIKGCYQSKVVLHQRVSFIKGKLSPKFVFNQKSSSIKGRPTSKVLLHQRSSHIKGNLPSKVILHQSHFQSKGDFDHMLSSIMKCFLPSKVVFHYSPSSLSKFVFHQV